MCNIWQGNSADFHSARMVLRPCASGRVWANGFGIYNPVGNVPERCQEATQLDIHRHEGDEGRIILMPRALSSQICRSGSKLVTPVSAHEGNRLPGT
jgi:hypothetical protein